MIEFTEQEDKILTAILDAVRAAGADYVYQSTGHPFYNQNIPGGCFYLAYDEGSKPLGTASCIVGHGLLDSGTLDVVSLVACEGKSADSIIPDHADSDTFSKALAMMQEEQDAGGPWGIAYRLGLAFLAGAGYDVYGYTL